MARPVALGVVTRPHGVRGEVRVHPYNPSSGLLLAREELLLIGPDGSVRPARVERAHRAGKAIVLSLSGVGRPEEAEALRGFEIGVPREALPPESEDELYLADLVGLEGALADGTAVGPIEGIIEYPSVVCLRVRGARGEIEVPLLPRYVTDVDFEAGRVTLDHVDELP